MKMTSGVTTALGGLVYSFHKRVKGIKSKFNISYVKRGNRKEKLDVFYPVCAKTKRSKRAGKKLYPAIVYYHGGGWSCYDKSLYVTLMRRLANMGFVVFSCNYSLAPKYKMDKIMEDARAAFKFVRDNGLRWGANTNIMILGGDSAGAHISSELTAEFIEERNPNIKLIRALLLFYGVYDFTTVTQSGFNNIKDYVDSSIPGGMNNNPELIKYSPMFKNLTEFPPVFMASGEVDKLHAGQSLRFYNVLNRNGVTTKAAFFNKNQPRAFHAFMNFDDLATTQEVLTQVNEFLHKTLRIK